jgi:N-terminal domain of galactosyltransferase/N-terminal region of glycosyl transferase group 7
MTLSSKLGIIVPYRDRADHLDEFISETTRFFATNPVNAGILPHVLIIEQAPGLPFNRGALLNAGFRFLAPEVDYICLHDVDRIPIEADYRWPEQPVMIIRHGLPLPPRLIDVLLSSVVLMQKQHFAAANGFSNGYWGWGYEDVDLRERLLRCGLVHAHRDGTFRSLPHLDLGSRPDGTPTVDAKKNQAIFLSRWFDRHNEGWLQRPDVGDGWLKDGLASLELSILSALRPFPHEACAHARIDKVTIDFPAPIGRT